MTILSRILIFDAPQNEHICTTCQGTGKCTSCRGSGKIKASSRMDFSTDLFCVGLAVMFFVSLTRLLGSTPNLLINIPVLAISGILSIVTMAEYKEQTTHKK